MTDWQEPAAVRFMLDDCTTWAVVGLSGNPARTAYRIASLLQSRKSKSRLHKLKKSRWRSFHR